MNRYTHFADIDKHKSRPLIIPLPTCHSHHPTYIVYDVKKIFFRIKVSNRDVRLFFVVVVVIAVCLTIKIVIFVSNAKNNQLFQIYDASTPL